MLKTNKDVLIAIELIRMTRQIRPLNLKNFSIMKKYDHNFVQQISRKLRKAGILGSIRGPGGGVDLIKTYDITALEVCKALGSVSDDSPLSYVVSKALGEYKV